ncbi:dUTP diphosphatase [Helicobacter anatolicus]|uniref:dUTP diphosphatase n=1 Tax=Helicobacter anatolicus TaxID=2905874 RepID=UPI001E50A8D8|nr:dUTP diphosphatase [Helicobacter anatolicus]MCE3037958.1 dUTP diphosphatase [Helicobacter anatolicus]
MKVKIKKIDQKAIIPSYQTQGAAGFDFHSIEDIVIKAGERGVVKTGLAMQLPEGYELQVRPRSGLALKHGITVLNTPGTIDSDYRGEIMVILINHSQEDFRISRGDRVAQGVITQYNIAEFLECEELDHTQRDDNGFGSTGIKG